MDNALIGKIFEGSVIAGCFVYLLFFITKTIATSQSSNQKEIVAGLAMIGEALHKMSENMLKMDMHLEQLEIRVRNLER